MVESREATTPRWRGSHESAGPEQQLDLVARPLAPWTTGARHLTRSIALADMTTSTSTPLAESSSPPAQTPPLTANLLRSFKPSRTLALDPLAKSTVLLGSLLSQPAILTLARAALPAEIDGLGGLIESLAGWQARGENGIYHWGGATPGGPLADGGLEINLVWPATELHIRKVRGPGRSSVYSWSLLTTIRSLYKARDAGIPTRDRDA